MVCSRKAAARSALYQSAWSRLKYLVQNIPLHQTGGFARTHRSDLGRRAITCWFQVKRQSYPPSAWTGSWWTLVSAPSSSAGRCGREPGWRCTSLQLNQRSTGQTHFQTPGRTLDSPGREHQWGTNTSLKTPRLNVPKIISTLHKLKKSDRRRLGGSLLCWGRCRWPVAADQVSTVTFWRRRKILGTASP